MAQLLLRGEALIGCPPEGLEAVLFDKDGTLAISAPMLQALAQARVFHCLELLEEHLSSGFSSQQRAETQQLLCRAYGLVGSTIHPAGTTAVASRNHNLISTATVLAQVGLGWPEALALSEEVFRRTDGLHGQGSAHPVLATEGMVDLVRQLSAAGVRCAVISNDEEAGIRAFLARVGLSQHFQAIWSADHRPCKPDPAAVHGLCRELDVSPGRCALIGDANSDLHMARQAGVAVVLGYRAAWSIAPPLDPAFAHLDHWRELELLTPETSAARSPGRG